MNPLAGNGGMLRNPRTEQDSLCHSLTHALAVYFLREAQLSFTVLSCSAAPSCVEVVTWDHNSQVAAVAQSGSMPQKS